MSLVLLSGLDDAIIGLGQRLSDGGHKAFLVYDVNKILDALVEREGMSSEDAVEFFQFNIQGAYLGESTPAFMTLMDYETVIEKIDEFQEIIEAESE